jgi:2-phosphoglycerate kinase
MEDQVRVILIGGSSHVGKTTLARFLAQRPGWKHVSTDSLARHPGRPWQTPPMSVPAHVSEHYLSLTVDELMDSVLAHYRKMGPMIHALITAHSSGPVRLVLEGSALWPQSVAAVDLPGVAGIWLTTGDDLFASRIYRESRFDEPDATGKALIAKFLERTRRYDREMMASVKRLGLPHLNVETTPSIDALADACLAQMAPLSRLG